MEDRFVDHVVDDFAWGIEGASGVAGGFAGFWVIGAEEVFEDAAEEFWVECDIGVEGSIFFDGEDVAREDIDEA